MRSATTLLLFLLAPLAFAEPPALRVIVSSGVTVDGRGLTSFEEPQSGGGGTIVFRASSQSIIVPDGAGVREVLVSGTALPAPLRGTINTIDRVRATADGFIVFDAELNGPDADAGIFALEGGALTTIIARRTSDAHTLTTFELDPSGTVVYATEGGVYRRTRSAGASELLAVPSAPVRDGPSLDADGNVAWVSDDGVFLWSSDTGVRDVARLGTPSALGTSPFTSFERSVVDVAGGTGVAYIAFTGSAEAAFVFDPATGESRVVAQVGTMVGGNPIERFERQIQIGADGTIYFRARIDRRRRWVASRGGGFQIVSRAPREDPGPADVAFQEGVYLSDGQRVRTVMRLGDDLDHVGRLIGVDTVRVRGDTVFATVEIENDDRTWLVRWRRGRLRPLLASGQSIPGVGAVGVIDAFDAAGDTVAIATFSGVVVRRGRRAQLIPRPKSLPDTSDFAIWQVRLAGSSVVIAASTYAPAASGVYASRGSRFVPLAETGKPLPGHRASTVSKILDVQAAGRRRLLGLELAGGDVGLFLAAGNRVTRLSTELPGEPPQPLDPTPIALDGRVALLAAEGVVYAATPTGPVVVVETGEATDHGTLDFYSADQSSSRTAFTAAGDEVVFATRLVGGDARAALLARAVGSAGR